jgi:hypothetical protein
MNHFIEEIPPADLVHLLPVLRKCFDDISPAEMSYLVENIASVLGITDLTLVEPYADGAKRGRARRN